MAAEVLGSRPSFRNSRVQIRDVGLDMCNPEARKPEDQRIRPVFSLFDRRELFRLVLHSSVRK